MISGRIRKNLESSGRSLIFKLLSRHLPGGTEETTKTLIQDSRSPDRHMNSGPPEHEAVVLITRPRISVSLRVQYKVLSVLCMHRGRERVYKPQIRTY
jgi:hypothetical protein